MSWSLRDACASVFSSEKYDVGRLVAGAGTARPPPGGTARGTTQRRPVRFEPSVFVRVARTLTERRLGEAPTNRPRIEGDVAFAGQPRVARVTLACGDGADRLVAEEEYAMCEYALEVLID